MDLSLPRGVDDIEPDRFARHMKVRDAFEEVSRLYNFHIMEPASLEHLRTLRVKSGQDIDNEIYAFRDKGGREVGLRFDLTVGITRYVCSRKDLKLPAKFSAFGSIWRYDEPQYGRYRWSHQWDLEIYGPPSVGADAEVVDAGSAILRKAGLGDFTIKIGDRRVVEEFIRNELKVTEDDRLVELMRALDKVEKKTTEELRAEYSKKGFDRKQIDDLLEFGRTRGNPDEVISKCAELKLQSSSELRTLADLLDSRGLTNIEYNLSVVRGIDYYTGIVFEASDNRNPRLGSLFGGGRFDSLPKMLGRPDLSATGAAGGIERISMSLEAKENGPGVLAFVAYASPGASPYAQRVLMEIRQAGIPCETALSPKGLSKQLEDAGKAGAAWVIIVGEKEMRGGSVTLREMATRKEETIPLPEALKRMVRQSNST